MTLKKTSSLICEYKLAITSTLDGHDTAISCAWSAPANSSSRYDNDESTNAAPVSAVPATTSIDTSKDGKNLGYGQEPDTVSAPLPDHNSASHNASNGLNDGEFQSGGQSHDDDDVHMTTERSGSNIKEDG
jgi:hypothetical protein